MITVLSYTAAAVGGFLVWAAIGGAAWSLVVTRLKRRRPIPPPLCVTVQRLLPPVPPTRSELAWLREQDVKALRGVDLRARFDDVIDSTRRAEENAS